MQLLRSLRRLQMKNNSQMPSNVKSAKATILKVKKPDSSYRLRSSGSPNLAYSLRNRSGKFPYNKYLAQLSQLCFAFSR